MYEGGLLLIKKNHFKLFLKMYHNGERLILLSYVSLFPRHKKHFLWVGPGDVYRLDWNERQRSEC